MNRRRKAAFRAAALVLAAALLVLFGGIADRIPDPPRDHAGTGESPASVHAESPAAEAFRAGQSGIWMQVSGEVYRLLPDDRRGSRHQRFLLLLPDRHTLLVSHNIDLAARAPLRKGDRVRARGRYEWNEKGGVLHWTHRDPSKRLDGGWIEHRGHRYR